MTAHTNTAGRLLPVLSLPLNLNADYLVKGWLGAGQTSMVYGPSNVGKSFFIFDLMWHVALGQSWNGYRVRPGKVVYVAGEGQNGLAQRKEAIIKTGKFTQSFSPEMFSVYDKRINLCDKTAARSFCDLLAGSKVDLIVVDTLSAAIGENDENLPATVNLLLKNIEPIREQSNSHVLFVHHTGKNEALGSRGTSAWKASVDTEIYLKSDDGLVCVSTTKQRDYQRADKLYFYLESAVLGIDTDGDDVTSCVVRYTSKGDRPKKLSKAKQSVLDGLEKALKQARDVHPGNAAIPPNTRVVDDYTWKEIVLSDTKLSPNAKDDSRRRSFARITKELIDDGLISTDDNGLFWLTEKTE